MELNNGRRHCSCGRHSQDLDMDTLGMITSRVVKLCSRPVPYMPKALRNGERQHLDSVSLLHRAHPNTTRLRRHDGVGPGNSDDKKHDIPQHPSSYHYSHRRSSAAAAAPAPAADVSSQKHRAVEGKDMSCVPSSNTGSFYLRMPAEGTVRHRARAGDNEVSHTSLLLPPPPQHGEGEGQEEQEKKLEQLLQMQRERHNGHNPHRHVGVIKVGSLSSVSSALSDGSLLSAMCSVHIREDGNAVSVQQFHPCSQHNSGDPPHPTSPRVSQQDDGGPKLVATRHEVLWQRQQPPPPRICTSPLSLHVVRRESKPNGAQVDGFFCHSTTPTSWDSILTQGGFPSPILSLASEGGAGLPYDGSGNVGGMDANVIAGEVRESQQQQDGKCFICESSSNGPTREQRKREAAQAKFSEALAALREVSTEAVSGAACVTSAELLESARLLSSAILTLTGATSAAPITVAATATTCSFPARPLVATAATMTEPTMMPLCKQSSEAAVSPSSAVATAPLISGHPTPTLHFALSQSAGSFHASSTEEARQVLREDEMHQLAIRLPTPDGRDNKDGLPLCATTFCIPAEESGCRVFSTDRIITATAATTTTTTAEVDGVAVAEDSQEKPREDEEEGVCVIYVDEDAHDSSARSPHGGTHGDDEEEEDSNDRASGAVANGEAVAAVQDPKGCQSEKSQLSLGRPPLSASRPSSTTMTSSLAPPAVTGTKQQASRSPGKSACRSTEEEEELLCPDEVSLSPETPYRRWQGSHVGGGEEAMKDGEKDKHPKDHLTTARYEYKDCEEDYVEEEREEEGEAYNQEGLQIFSNSPSLPRHIGVTRTHSAEYAISSGSGAAGGGDSAAMRSPTWTVCSSNPLHGIESYGSAVTFREDTPPPRRARCFQSASASAISRNESSDAFTQFQSPDGVNSSTTFLHYVYTNNDSCDSGTPQVQSRGTRGGGCECRPETDTRKAEQVWVDEEDDVHAVPTPFPLERQQLPMILGGLCKAKGNVLDTSSVDSDGDGGHVDEEVENSVKQTNSTSTQRTSQLHSIAPLVRKQRACVGTNVDGGNGGGDVLHTDLNCEGAMSLPARTSACFTTSEPHPVVVAVPSGSGDSNSTSRRSSCGSTQGIKGGRGSLHDESAHLGDGSISSIDPLSQQGADQGTSEKKQNRSKKSAAASQQSVFDDDNDVAVYYYNGGPTYDTSANGGDVAVDRAVSQLHSRQQQQRQFRRYLASKCNCGSDRDGTVVRVSAAPLRSWARRASHHATASSSSSTLPFISTTGEIAGTAAAAAAHTAEESVASSHPREGDVSVSGSSPPSPPPPQSMRAATPTALGKKHTPYEAEAQGGRGAPDRARTSSGDSPVRVAKRLYTKYIRQSPSPK